MPDGFSEEGTGSSLRLLDGREESGTGADQTSDFASLSRRAMTSIACSPDLLPALAPNAVTAHRIAVKAGFHNVLPLKHRL